MGHGGTHLESQHSGGRSRQISESLASLVYRPSSKIARATQRNPVSQKQKQKQKQRNKYAKKKPGFSGGELESGWPLEVTPALADGA